MRAMIFVLFCIAPTLATSQDLKTIRAFYRDSVEIIRSCDCEKSPARYRDEYDKLYPLWLDRETMEVFIVVRKSKRRAKRVVIHSYSL